MKPNGIAWNTLLDPQADIIGDEHIATSLETPLRPDAFLLDDDTKVALIAEKFRDIMDIMGLDLTDDSLKGTPNRVAKMYVQEIFSGLSPANQPKISLFENVYRYNEMLLEKNITVKSFCEHHFLPITGKAHVAYISSGHVIGLSKINRIVDYFARRPQVQERLTMQIANELKRVLKTEDVAVMLDASHMCVSMRGIEDDSSSTVTSSFSGAFRKDSMQQKFMAQISA
jgi:GTP cyclohydrolase I